MPWFRCLTLGMLVSVLALTGGCGSGPDMGPLLPVEGGVLVAGKPLSGKTVDFAKVWFYPDPQRGNLSVYVPLGVVDASGRYRLKTGGKSGAPPGWYRVMVVAVARPNASASKKRTPRTSLIHRKYESAETSGIRVEVVNGPRPGAYDLVVAPPR